MVDLGGLREAVGEVSRVFALASVTKPLVAYAVMVAVEEGALDLDEPAGPPGSTVRHLLAHTAGYGFESDAAVLAAPGARRVYSNRGFEVLGVHLEKATGIPVPVYVSEAVFEPLRMSRTVLDGSPAFGARSTAEDLARFAAELIMPRLISPRTAEEFRQVHFPGLPGVLPGVGRYEPLDWGLGVERNFGRPGHWAGQRVSGSAFGHFGGAGTFLWVDPQRQLGCVCLTDLAFGPWALQAWPPLCDAVAALSPR
ncbi:MAG TPA: serine hydrolase domain-containing protein [Kineosporiaceae bacterium]|nr:serine hydrolase domain-containing protein [Kineosporiaceae bacterium]